MISNVQILHQENHFIICCKPVGMECESQLPQTLAQLCGGTAQEYYCVHRLDQVVSGVMVYARNQKTAANLSAQIQNHQFSKEYLAVVAGVPEEPAGTMVDFLYKDATKGRAFPVKKQRKGVKEARLSYRALQSQTIQDTLCSLIEIKLETGRFHQIRAQFAARKLPLLGDGKYGSRIKGCTVALFSFRIGFLHPSTGVPVSFQALPPQQMPWDSFVLPE